MIATVVFARVALGSSVIPVVVVVGRGMVLRAVETVTVGAEVPLAAVPLFGDLVLLEEAADDDWVVVVSAT